MGKMITNMLIWLNNWSLERLKARGIYKVVLKKGDKITCATTWKNGNFVFIPKIDRKEVI